MCDVYLFNGKFESKHRNYFEKIGVKENSVVYFGFDEDEKELFFVASRSITKTEAESLPLFCSTKGISVEEYRQWQLESVFGMISASEVEKKLIELQKEFTQFEHKQHSIIPDHKYQWHTVHGLHVHHRHYQIGKLPWEYTDDVFLTVCAGCHQEIHDNENIPILDEKGNELENYVCCKRCNGSGYLPQYRHVQAGVCFACWGSGYGGSLVLGKR